ncbi:MAG: hypothetical protein ACRD0W_23015, partial [Acidimicrobiales bacterium]
LGRRPVERHMTDDRDDQLRRWRQAIAAHNRAKRNRRGRRNRNPYARAQPVRYIEPPTRPNRKT